MQGGHLVKLNIFPSSYYRRHVLWKRTHCSIELEPIKIVVSVNAYILHFPHFSRENFSLMPSSTDYSFLIPGIVRGTLTNSKQQAINYPKFS